MRKWTLVTGVALAAFASGAYAQDNGPNNANTLEKTGIEEIIVTAQRREETVQKSSLAIEVLKADEVQAIASTRDLQALVPGLQIGQGGALAQVYIRGVGDFSGNSNSNPGVGYSVDGVVVARPEAVSLATFDVARVEVLKGPQGTLFGRNSTGGTINVINRRPEMGETGGYVNAEVGSFDLFRATGALNLAVGETVAARIAFAATRRDGYMSDGTNDEKHNAVRAMLKFEPTEKFSVLLNGEYVHVFGKGPGFVPNPRPAGSSPWLGSGDPVAIADFAATPGLGPLLATLYNNFDPFLDKKAWSVSAELEYDLDWAQLKVLPAYRSLNYRGRSYPGLLILQDQQDRQFSTEVQLGNSTPDLKWVIGLYYFDEKNPSNSFVDFGPETVSTPYPISKTQSYAAFGETTVSIAPDFRLIAGGRYTRDKRQYGGSLIFNSLIRPVGPPFSWNNKGTFNSFTWKLGAEYDLSPDNMIFATASTGFKQGGFNGVAPTDSHVSYRPEKLTAFQLGSRNRFLDNRVQINLELFYWLYKDHQEGITTLDDSGAPNFLVLNAGKGRMYGFNVDLVAQPSGNDTIRATVEYLNAKYTDFVAPYAAFAVAPGINTTCPTTFAGPTAFVDCSGFPLTRAPELTGSAGWTHIFDLGGNGKLESDLNVSFSSDSFATGQYTASVKQPSWIKANASLTYRPEDGGWSVTGYVNNITNDVSASGSQFSTFAPPLAHWVVAPPRSYGLRLNVEF